MPSRPRKPLRPLRGLRILSLCLNLPGPAALMRCRAMGAGCVKLEPPGSGDPMLTYCPEAFAAMHHGIRRIVADLKTAPGQKILHRELLKTDILLTSFRPSALRKLGLDWQTLHPRYPGLSQVAIVGAPGVRAEEAGHDLTYVAEHHLIHGLELPATLYADMGGSLLVSEAVLGLVASQRSSASRSDQASPAPGLYQEIALSNAAAYLALPRHWGLTQPGADVGGGHAGYRVYACQDGRVALAALEPHFAASLCLATGLPSPTSAAQCLTLMRKPSTQRHIETWLKTQTMRNLDQLAQERDIPLLTIPAKA